MRKREIARMTGISCNRHEIITKHSFLFHILFLLFFFSPGLHTILLGSAPYVPGGQISHAVISTKKREYRKNKNVTERKIER